MTIAPRAYLTPVASVWKRKSIIGARFLLPPYRGESWGGSSGRRNLYHK